MDGRLTRVAKRARRNDPRLTASTLLNGAIDFADLADVYAAQRPGLKRNPLLLTFLLARALELALKAVLRKDGVIEDDLLDLGHNVQRAHQSVWRAHRPTRLKLSPTREHALRLLGRFYTGKLLEYTVVGAYELPHLYTLRGMVHETIRFALDHVHGPGTYKSLAKLRTKYARGVEIAPDAKYGNTSRKRALRHQQRQLRELIRAAMAGAGE